MGVPVTLLGGMLLGGLLGSKFNKSPDMSSLYSNQAASMQELQSSVPTAPAAPIADDGTKSAAMLAAEEEERRKRLAEAEANKTNYTGGLGVTTPANVSLKQLLG